MEPDASSPRLVLKPDFAGRLDFELRWAGETITRLAAAGGARVPGVFAELFDDPFAPPDEIDALVGDWIGHANPLPAIAVATGDGLVDAVVERPPVEVEATLDLDVRERDVVVARAVAGAPEVIPLGANLAFLPGGRKLVRVSNPSVWRALGSTGALAFAMAPVTTGGQAFRPASAAAVPLEETEADPPRVVWPPPRGFNLRTAGTAQPLPDGPVRATATIAIEFAPETRRATIELRSDPPFAPFEPGDRRPLLRWSGAWEVVAPPGEETWLALHRVRSCAGADSEGTATAAAVLDRLAEMFEIANRAGVPLTIDGRATTAGELEVAAVTPPDGFGDGTGERDIDWFELRPEIACAGFRLAESEWEEVLRRGYFDPASRGASGGPVVIAPGSMRQLAEVEAVVRGYRRAGAAPPAGPRRSATASHLEVLGWLRLARAGVRLGLPPEARAIVDALLGESRPEPVPPPPGLRAELRPYQADGYRWLTFLHQHRFGAVLADDMGLGKTLQTLAFLAGATSRARVHGRPAAPRPAPAPHLIVVPPTLAFNWQAEARKFCPALRVAVYAGSGRDPTALMSADIVITTYDVVRRDFRTLRKTEFDVLVFDEAQAVKNLRSSRAQAARKLHGRFVLCLTGTPLENSLKEYHAIVDLALPGLLGDAESFAEEVAENPDHPLVLRAAPFVLRRTRAAVLKDLPPKTESDVLLDLGDDQKELYTRTVAEVREEVAAAYASQPKNRAAISALAALTRLRQACVSPLLLNPKSRDQGPKIAYVTSAVSELACSGQAALVFSQFTRALDVVEIALGDAGVPIVRLDGSTPRAEREQLVNWFQSGPPAPPVFLISLRTGAAGLNLTRASYVFHLDPWWNPAVEDQASARAHRFGQANTVVIQRLLMRHTVEEKMMELKARKRAIYDRVVAAAEANADGRASPGATPLTAVDIDLLLGGGIGGPADASDA